MTEAAADRTSLAYMVEATFGTAPAGSSQYRLFRTTGNSLASTVETTRSAELRSDRQVTAYRRTGQDAGGSVNVELSVDEGTEQMIAAGLQTSDFATPSAAIGISNISGNTITLDSTTSMADGTFIRMTGNTVEANNGCFKVNGAVSTSASVVVHESLTADAGATGEMVEGVSIANGTTQNSYTIEQEFTDLTNEFAVYRGQTLSGLSFSVTDGGFVEVGLEFMGKDEESPRPDTSKDSGTYIAAGTATQFSSPDDIQAILINDVEYDFVSFDVSISNALRARRSANNLGSTSIGAGTLAVSGNLTALMEDEAKMDLYLAFTTVSLAIKFSNASGGYVLELPSVQLSDGSAPPSGQDQGITESYAFEAQKESSGSENTVRVWAFA